MENSKIISNLRIHLTIIVFVIACSGFENQLVSQENVKLNDSVELRITDITISGQSIFKGKYHELKEEFTKTKSIKLKNRRNDIEFFLISWEIIDPQRKDGDIYYFSYTIEGLDDHWFETYNKQATFQISSPGKYQFSLKFAKNGDWNESTTQNFTIDISPEFYQTPWFYLAYLAGITFAIMFFMRIRMNIELSVNLLIWAVIYVSFVLFIAADRMQDIIRSQEFFKWNTIYFLFIVPAINLIGPLINFYIFYLILIPGFLIRKKIILFIVLALFSSILTGYFMRLTFDGSNEVTMTFTFTAFMLICGFLGGVTRKIVLWRKYVAEKIELNKKLIINKTALLMLQAQLNPHFLFNSLNNIDILVEENPKTASEYLKKLSDILRYVLYETKEDETDLAKEIDQIKSYIELQKIRTDNPHYVNFTIKGELKDQKIAPMLFIPFIENAFKHCKNKSIENAIQIEFEMDEHEIKMVCKNFYEENQLEIIKNEGLGIETIKQRLNLLYPKNHELKIDKVDNWFSVSLRIHTINRA